MFDENEERIFEIYNYFRKTIKNKFKEYDLIEEELLSNYKTLIQKYKEVTNKECFNEIINYINSDQLKDPQEYENKLSNLNECYNKFDFGLKRIIDDSIKEIEILDDILYECNTKCVENPKERDDREIKKCYEKCFDKSFDDVMFIQNSILTKIKDNQSKLNKI